MALKTYKAGEVIFSEGDESQEAYWLVSGQVEISIKAPSGQRPLGQLHPGEVFGEMGLVDDQPRSASATAISDCEVEVITEDDFEEVVLGNPERLHSYLETLFERLRTSGTMLQMALKRQQAAGSIPPAQPATMETPSN